MTDSSTTDPTFRVNDYPFLHMAQIVVAVQERIVSRITSYPLTPSSWRALALLAESEGLTVKALAQAAALERSSISRIVAQLERDGLVERLPNPTDGRSRLLTLTPRARAVFRECEPVAQEVMQRSLGALSPGECDALMGTLDKIITRLQLQLPGR